MGAGRCGDPSPRNRPSPTPGPCRLPSSPETPAPAPATPRDPRPQPSPPFYLGLIRPEVEEEVDHQLQQPPLHDCGHRAGSRGLGGSRPPSPARPPAAHPVPRPAHRCPSWAPACPARPQARPAAGTAPAAPSRCNAWRRRVPESGARGRALPAAVPAARAKEVLRRRPGSYAGATAPARPEPLILSITCARRQRSGAYEALLGRTGGWTRRPVVIHSQAIRWTRGGNRVEHPHTRSVLDRRNQEPSEVGHPQPALGRELAPRERALGAWCSRAQRLPARTLSPAPFLRASGSVHRRPERAGHAYTETLRLFPPEVLFFFSPLCACAEQSWRRRPKRRL